MMLISEIKSTQWSSYIREVGEVVTDLEDIKQCFDIILMTKKGTAPFRPFFGCDLFDRLDEPMNVAAPKIANDIRNAITKYETRVVLGEINFSFVADGSVEFSIYWKPVEGTKFGQENTAIYGIRNGIVYIVNEFNQYFETEHGIIEY